MAPPDKVWAIPALEAFTLGSVPLSGAPFFLPKHWSADEAMISSARELAAELLRKGFAVEVIQEEDEVTMLDAEIEIAPDIVVQIGWTGSKPEYGVTIEPRRVKREYSDFRHVGYFGTMETLFVTLEKLRLRRA